MNTVTRKLLAWLTTRVECAWCSPNRRIGGNPLAKKVSHGICKGCLEKMRRQIVESAKG